MKKSINKNSMKKSSNADASAVILRIKNVQGQLGGISRMIENKGDCVSVVTQFKAARAGIDKALDVFLEVSLRGCVGKSVLKNKKEEFNRIVAELTK